MIAEYRVEAALALLARRVDVSASRGRLVALRALRGPQRLAGLSPTPAGIARLRRSAALLAASSFMIRASIPKARLSMWLGNASESAKQAGKAPSSPWWIRGDESV